MNEQVNNLAWAVLDESELGFHKVCLERIKQITGQATPDFHR